MNSALIIFIKNPESGKVKTRLAATVGNEEALRIYNKLLDHTREVTLNFTGLNRYIYYSNFIDTNDDWKTPFFVKKLQNGNNLGERLTNAFSEVFEESQPVLVIGSDCPTLSPNILSSAFDALKESDFVIGPAIDGGYYLLGMNKFEPTVFQNIEWSTEHVFTQTKSTIEKLGKTFNLLPELPDIDREEDWKQWGW